MSAPYAPRRPQETVLYGLVKAHWRDLVQHARETYTAPLPKYVVEELQAYLSCGDLSSGFVVASCGSCGHALLVAFSCKKRGLCPSCAGRRMAGSAAHLVDRILPAQPLRQYVLSLPYELSALAAVHPDVLTHLCRVFWEALRRRYAQWAKGAGYTSPETGAVTGVQRFGSSLNVHVHFHLLMLDGVHIEREGDLRFVPAPAPTRSELAGLLAYVRARAVKWLARRGYLRDPDAEGASNDAWEPSPEEALVGLGTQRGTLATLREAGAADERDEPHGRAGSSEGAVTLDRFNLHASVTLRADDDLGRERLCRYLTRPAFALERIHVRPDGNVTYRVKKVSRGRATHRVMTPLEFLARRAALIPPPRYPLLRFHGVLAPRHGLRARVVPRPPTKRPRSCPAARSAAPPDQRSAGPGDGSAAFAPEPKDPFPMRDLLGAASAATHVAPNVLSVAHWARLHDGELFAPLSRVEWATLLRRTFDVDVRTCLRCGGRLDVRAVVTEPASRSRRCARALRLRGPRPPSPEPRPPRAAPRLARPARAARSRCRRGGTAGPRLHFGDRAYTCVPSLSSGRAARMSCPLYFAYSRARRLGRASAATAARRASRGSSTASTTRTSARSIASRATRSPTSAS